MVTTARISRPGDIDVTKHAPFDPGADAAGVLALLAAGAGVTVHVRRWSEAARPDGEQAASVSCVNGARLCDDGTTSGSVVIYRDQRRRSDRRELILMLSAARRPVRAMVVLLVVTSLLAAGMVTLGSSGAQAAPGMTTHSQGRPPAEAGRSTLDSVSCVSATFCMAGDESGGLLRFNGTSWTTSKQFAGGTGRLESVSCTSTRFCMAAYEPATGRSFYLLTYNGHSWKQSRAYGGKYVANGDCASSRLCFVMDKAGNIHGWTGRNWVVLSFGEIDMFRATGCASATRCFTVGGYGDLLRYNGHTWTNSQHSLGHGTDWSSLSCPTAASCMAVSRRGNYAHYAKGVWLKTTRIGGDDRFVGLTGACGSATFCAAVDEQGRTATYEDGAWSADAKPLAGTKANAQLNGARAVSCAAANSCIAVGYQGGYWVRTAKGWGPKRIVAPAAIVTTPGPPSADANPPRRP